MVLRCWFEELHTVRVLVSVKMAFRVVVVGRANQRGFAKKLKLMILKFKGLGNPLFWGGSDT